MNNVDINEVELNEVELNEIELSDLVSNRVDPGRFGSNEAE